MLIQRRLLRFLRALSKDSTLSEQEQAACLKEVESYWRKEVTRRGISFFTREVLGYLNAPHQEEWYGIMQNKSLKKIADAAPRGHTKSTCFTVNYPLWRIAEDHDLRILIVTNAESQGQSFLSEIVSHVERNQTYVDFAGQLKPKVPKKWTAREIVIDRKGKLKDPTISTVGVGGTILSKRADEIICDDILSPENTRTPEQRAKLKEWFFQVLLPVLKPGGRVIFVGTVWHPQDLLSEILDDPSWDYRKKFKAVIEWPSNMDIWQEWYALRMAGTEESVMNAKKFFVNNYYRMMEGAQVLWPEYFTFDMLYLIWRSNRVAFEKAYQNNIVSREDQKFKEEWLEAAKVRGANLRLTKSLTPDQRKEMKICTAGIDLAAGEDEQDDDNAMATLGLRRMDDMVMLLGLEGGKFTPKAWRQAIGDTFDGFHHDRIIVESNAYQVSIKRDLAERNLPIVGFATGGEKFDPFIGVESLSILFENNRIILPYDKTDPYTVAMVDRLVDELRQFPMGHTGDFAMGLWFAYTALRDMTPKTGQHGFLQMVQNDIARLKESQTKPVGMPAWVQIARNQQS